jgi:hypothetical protein
VAFQFFREIYMTGQRASTITRIAAGVFAALGALGLAVPASAERDTSFTALLSQDNFFGFYPSFNGLVEVNDKIDFSFYGIMWTTSLFGTNLGSDLWTEFGAGININAADGKLAIKPQLGFTNGVLLSTPATDDSGDVGGNVFDGIVPSLTINYSGERLEAEWYSGYYAALKNRGDPGTLDFLHLWANGGYKFSPYVSAGLHYEWLDNTVNEGGQAATVYQWFGPYLQFSMPQGFFARFSGGAQLEDGAAGDFYKLTMGMSF